jgi:hypothetical protein
MITIKRSNAGEGGITSPDVFHHFRDTLEIFQATSGHAFGKMYA